MLYASAHYSDYDKDFFVVVVVLFLSILDQVVQDFPFCDSRETFLHFKINRIQRKGISYQPRELVGTLIIPTYSLRLSKLIIGKFSEFVVAVTNPAMPVVVKKPAPQPSTLLFPPKSN